MIDYFDFFLYSNPSLVFIGLIFYRGGKALSETLSTLRLLSKKSFLTLLKFAVGLVIPYLFDKLENLGSLSFVLETLSFFISSNKVKLRHENPFF